VFCATQHASWRHHSIRVWGETRILFISWNLAAGEALDNGVQIAVCSTSNERAVATIVRRLLGADVAAVMRVFAGVRLLLRCCSAVKRCC
jgi:hypothetical protein